MHALPAMCTLWAGVGGNTLCQCVGVGVADNQVRVERAGYLTTLKPSAVPSDRSAVVMKSLSGDKTGRIACPDSVDCSILG